MGGFEDVECLSTYSPIGGVLAKRVVVVHPIVLLSVVDHYNRVAKGTSRRVVGCLLGEVQGGEAHITNSFAVPFEEDHKDSNVWFLDQGYLQQLFIMFKKVNTLEKILGWYSTGKAAKAQDLKIHQIFRQFNPNPYYLLVDVEPEDQVVPAKAYCGVEEATNSKDFRQTFVHVPCTIGACEAEEVGVEHLLRDIKNKSTSTLATKVGDQLGTLKMLSARLCLIAEYLRDVSNGSLTLNPNIIYTVQEIFNLLPDTTRPALLKAFATQTNDSMMTIYLASVVRSVLALHNLIDNKIQNKREAELKEKEAAKTDEEKQKKQKEKKEEVRT